MKTNLFLSVLLLAITFGLQAQTDTIPILNLLDELTLEANETIELLPTKFPITQKILWGKKGLMRNFNRFELTPKKRQNELKLRRTMLATHQIMGFVTLGGMVAQGIVGAKLYKGDQSIKETHKALAIGVNIAYFSTASLSLFAPPKMLNERKGYSNIKLHKVLAIVHFSSMLATNILASQIENNPNLRPYHRAAAFTAFGSFAISMVVIKF
jgi:hypothetical protein